MMKMPRVDPVLVAIHLIFGTAVTLELLFLAVHIGLLK